MRPRAPIINTVRVCRLQQKKNAQKKLAVTVFSFPPDKGNVGTAAYLNVFGSIFKVLQSLQMEGYDVGELPANGEELIQTVSFTALSWHLYSSKLILDVQDVFPL